MIDWFAHSGSKLKVESVFQPRGHFYVKRFCLNMITNANGPLLGRIVYQFIALGFDPEKSHMILSSVLANPKPPALSCKINGRLFHDGESAEVLQQSVDKSSIVCQQCKCDAGKHKCHKIFDCDIQELGCEKSVKITGQCCPVCGTYPLHIIHINFVKWWWDWTLIKIM